jgi:hypothetical protein
MAHRRFIAGPTPRVSVTAPRLMLRPRESRDLRLISSNVAVMAAAAVTRAHDVFGNAVAMATFQTMADSLVIDSVDMRYPKKSES